MLQENPITGFFFLIGIVIGSVNMGVGVVVTIAIVTALGTSLFLGYDKEKINQGFFGFSPALIGVALTLFLKLSFVTYVLIILCSIFGTMLQHFFYKKKIAVFTLPFVLVIWAIYYFSKEFYPNLLAEPTMLYADSYDIYLFPIKGFGQVIFQDKLISGIIFFVAVLINSRYSAICGLLGGIVAGFIAYILQIDTKNILLGLFSYNTILCTIAISYKTKSDVLWMLFATILSVFITIGMNKIHFMTLTFPFVVATMLTLYFKNIIHRIKEGNVFEK
ncbi:MAG: urea transporter [Bacteroidales bacterium]|nr:MAG: urea transporter [Bacteroidales bacterium]